MWIIYHHFIQIYRVRNQDLNKRSPIRIHHNVHLPNRNHAIQIHRMVYEILMIFIMMNPRLFDMNIEQHHFERQIFLQLKHFQTMLVVGIQNRRILRQYRVGIFLREMRSMKCDQEFSVVQINQKRSQPIESRQSRNQVSLMNWIRKNPRKMKKVMSWPRVSVDRKSILFIFVFLI